MIKFYGYKKCDTCRKAEARLKALGREYEFIDITASPPGAAQLRQVAALAGITPLKMFNTSGVQYRELDIKSRLPQLSEAQIFDLLAGNGRLIKRPVVSDGERASVGYKEAEFAQCWR